MYLDATAVALQLSLDCRKHRSVRAMAALPAAFSAVPGNILAQLTRDVDADFFAVAAQCAASSAASSNAAAARAARFAALSADRTRARNAKTPGLDAVLVPLASLAVSTNNSE
ncbi:hypothetical protein HK100_008296 [Physocladia obscura]|uniref:Uncharacterized protein n=1 Tax=Physocladia obscura TaxID=109957 RepID=A0AAD5T600_9FUNG|nr:hypothetical protein HK100_008296 [Physocladia obscura]